MNFLTCSEDEFSEAFATALAANAVSFERDTAYRIARFRESLDSDPVAIRWPPMQTAREVIRRAECAIADALASRVVATFCQVFRDHPEFLAPNYFTEHPEFAAFLAADLEGLA